MSQNIGKSEELIDKILQVLNLNSNVIEKYEEMSVFNNENEKLLVQFKNEHGMFLNELNCLFKKFHTMLLDDDKAKLKPVNCVTRVMDSKRYNKEKMLEKRQLSRSLVEEELNKYCF